MNILQVLEGTVQLQVTVPLWPYHPEACEAITLWTFTPLQKGDPPAAKLSACSLVATAFNELGVIEVDKTAETVPTVLGNIRCPGVKLSKFVPLTYLDIYSP
jgi:hypothetical protein